jgi:hypothetical protein
VARDPAEFAAQERAQRETHQHRLRREEATRARLRKRKVAAQARKVRFAFGELAPASARLAVARRAAARRAVPLAPAR